MIILAGQDITVSQHADSIYSHKKPFPRKAGAPTPRGSSFPRNCSYWCHCVNAEPHKDLKTSAND